eukprot:11923152-Ditylum_brightwellii.AAC.1
MEAQIGQTAFKFFLSCNPVGQDELEHIEELFYVYKVSFHRGKAYNDTSQPLKDATDNIL